MTRREFIQSYLAYNPPVCGDETEQIKRAEMCADALEKTGHEFDFDLTHSMLSRQFSQFNQPDISP